MSRKFANGLVEALNRKVEMINSKIIQAGRFGSWLKSVCRQWSLGKIISSSILQQNEHGMDKIDKFKRSGHVHEI
jgi:hypothetical protein